MPDDQNTTTAAAGGTAPADGTTASGGTTAAAGEGANALQQALINHVAGAVETSRKQTTRQMIFACILMLAGAAVGVISVELKETAVVAGFGTALIGAGATLLPAGASASANAQLHSALTQLAILAAPPQGLAAPQQVQQPMQPVQPVQPVQQPVPQPQVPAPTPQPQVTPAPVPPLNPASPSGPAAGQQTSSVERLALPAGFDAAPDNSVVTDAEVVSAADADAADAAALRAEQPQ
jgi:hypothetical protein